MTYIVSATTRPKKPGDETARPTSTSTSEEFFRRLDHDEFLEYAQVYGDYYGTPKHPALDYLSEGKDVLLEIDVQGALQVRYQYPDALLIFILPPDEPTLLQRLTDRGRDSGRHREAFPRGQARDPDGQGQPGVRPHGDQRQSGPGGGRNHQDRSRTSGRAGHLSEHTAGRHLKEHETMIEALKSDEIVNKVGGRFKLTALIQKRMLELMDGARPLVERDGHDRPGGGHPGDPAGQDRHRLRGQRLIARTGRRCNAHCADIGQARRCPSGASSVTCPIGHCRR